jgi:uncharacterized protein (TIRG00374 family)
MKKNLIVALGLGLGVYLVLAVVSDLKELWEALSGFDYRLMPLILGLVCLSYAVRFVRWVYYLRILKVSIPVRTNIVIFAAGLSMTISPGKFGEVLKSVFIKDAVGTPVARTAPAVVAERITDGTGMVAWGLMGALAFNLGPEVLVLFLALVMAGIALLRSERLSLLAERVLLKLPLLHHLAPHVEDFYESSNELLALRPLATASAVSFLAWGLDCSSVYLCTVGMGVEESFSVVVFIYAVSLLAGNLSMLPGGIGVAEGGLTGLFATVAGLPRGLSVALTLVIRLATLWFATLIGILGLLLVRRVIGEPAGTNLLKARTEGESKTGPEP